MTCEKLAKENLHLRERNRELKREIRKMVAGKFPDIDKIVGAMLEEYRDRCEVEFEFFRERFSTLVDGVQITMPSCEFEGSLHESSGAAA